MKLMKICVLTFHRADNYGAMLQSFALQKKISEIGVEAEILDYRGTGIEQQYRGKKITEYSSAKELLSTLYKKIRYHKKAKSFAEFREKIKISNAFYTDKNISTAAEKYDRFIVGSDQVWNYECTKNDKNYFLSFVTDLDKKYSYAASFGTDAPKNEYKEEYKKHLQSFSHISLREISGAEYVKREMQYACDVNIDPVLLLAPQKWTQELLQIKPLHTHKFIFVYQLLKSNRMIEFAEKKAREEGLDVIFISRSLYKGKNFIDKSYAGPQEFLWYLANAEMIITNSFHGMAFSLLFNKEFYLDFSETANTKSRLQSLGELMGIGDRWIANGVFDDIDYNAVNMKIAEQVNISEEYLRSICCENSKKT